MSRNTWALESLKAKGLDKIEYREAEEGETQRLLGSEYFFRLLNFVGKMTNERNLVSKKQSVKNRRALNNGAGD